MPPSSQQDRGRGGGSGYFSEDNVTKELTDGPELLIATASQRKRCADARPAPRGRMPKNLSPKQKMDRKLRTKRGRALCRKRSQTVEPVFGQHRMRQLLRFQRRGREACDCDWKLENTAHNLLKLWRTGAHIGPDNNKPTLRSPAGRCSQKGWSSRRSGWARRASLPLTTPLTLAVVLRQALTLSK